MPPREFLDRSAALQTECSSDIRARIALLCCAVLVIKQCSPFLALLHTLLHIRPLICPSLFIQYPVLSSLMARQQHFSSSLVALSLSLSLLPFSPVGAVVIGDAPNPVSYCVPSHPCFPSHTQLAAFNASISGHLVTPQQIILPCYSGPDFSSSACEHALKNKDDPYWRADQPGASMFTQWSGNGTVDTCPPPSSLRLAANASSPSPTAGTAPGICGRGRVAAYSVQAENEEDVSRAVKFAAQHRLRLRIRNTGHDYLGRSTAEDSFTISTKLLNETKVVDDWLPHCSSSSAHEDYSESENSLSNRYVKPGDQQVILDASTLGTQQKRHKGRKVIVAGPAVYVNDLYRIAGENNVTVVGGVARTVGATGGWAVGGGHGPLGRMFGMGVDSRSPALRMSLIAWLTKMLQMS